MEISTDILNELKEFSPFLAGMEKQNVFTVPSGYFEELNGHILMAVTATHSPVLDQLSRANTASVPAGYFEGLADNILNRIKAQEQETAIAELNSLSPLLSSISGHNVYEVPSGYFDGFAASMVSKLQPGRSKLVIMRKRTAGFMKYAVAAAFTGVMALAVFKFTSTTDLTGQQSAWTMNVDKEMDKVSKDDIIGYLEANGEGVDAITVAEKTVDEKDMPTQADYLNDDNALDKYFDNSNANELKN